MNEIELIRAQLATERTHALEVSGVLRAALGADADGATGDGARAEECHRAAREYLRRALASCARRDERLAALARRLPAGEALRRSLEVTLAGPGASLEALAKLDAQSWRELADELRGGWKTRHEMLEALLAAGGTVSAWREFAGVDADSVLEERAAYAQVRAALPAGVTLPIPDR